MDQPPVAGQDYWLVDEYAHRARPRNQAHPVGPNRLPSRRAETALFAVALLTLLVLIVTSLPEFIYGRS